MADTPQSTAIRKRQDAHYDLSMPVWQFVRLMVQIEQTLAQFSDTNLREVYNEWEDFWVALDAKLLDAGKRSREEFANLMMDQDVVMHGLTLAQCGLLRREIRRVIVQVRRQANLERSKEEKRNLNFEARELELLIQELTLLSPA